VFSIMTWFTTSIRTWFTLPNYFLEVNMPWREVDTMSLRKQFIEEYLENSKSISGLCRAFNISRVTAYKWINRFKEEGTLGLYNRSNKPLSSPSKTHHTQIDTILELRDKFPAWGARKLRQVLIDEGHINIPSESTFNRILNKHERIDYNESQK